MYGQDLNAAGVCNVNILRFHNILLKSYCYGPRLGQGGKTRTQE